MSLGSQMVESILSIRCEACVSSIKPVYDIVFEKNTRTPTQQPKWLMEQV